MDPALRWITGSVLNEDLFAAVRTISDPARRFRPIRDKRLRTAPPGDMET
jgi:hypothetical protein